MAHREVKFQPVDCAVRELEICSILPLIGLRRPDTSAIRIFHSISI